MAHNEALLRNVDHGHLEVPPIHLGIHVPLGLSRIRECVVEHVDDGERGEIPESLLCGDVRKSAFD